ncbi:hypothetical protein OOZ15_12055 [Galbibacter sp. EGI 63066]|uniref:hypothetical protein n=1 Tax=Galbibacter sp. EGI 63066 TaxID=2993559 RepID=UPI0022488F8D|nr:hypothetical protein [Galbibacter sp. EGI 63066]MCX2680678.1 hypothetical protein [Galbibacter sp. EGI 63066]
MLNSLNQIEKNYNVLQLEHKGICVWPVIKSYLITLNTQNSEILKEVSGYNIKILLRNIFSDIFSFFNIYKSDIWVFTNSERRYEINNLHFDRITSSLLNYFGEYILFENPVPKGKTKKWKLQKGEFLIGMSWIYLIQFVIIKLTKRPKISRLSDLEEHLNTNLDKIRKIYHRHHAGSIFYKLLFKIKKPKKVFVVCYYSNFGLIKACKESNIPVIELQHGIVTKEHRAYYFNKNYGNFFLPDYFFGFGNYFNKIVSDGNLVDKKKTLNYGYSFLHEVNAKLEKPDDFLKIYERFDKVICVTGQLESTDRHLLRVMDKITEKFPEIYFIFKPRNKKNKIPFPEKGNFVRRNDINTYQLLKYSDFHITIYSTCALESIALGTPNISIDIEGLYTQHLKELIHENEYNFYAKNENDLESIISNLKSRQYHREKVSLSIKEIMAPMISKELFFGFFQQIVGDIAEH